MNRFEKHSGIHNTRRIDSRSSVTIGRRVSRAVGVLAGSLVFSQFCVAQTALPVVKYDGAVDGNAFEYTYWPSYWPVRENKNYIGGHNRITGPGTISSSAGGPAGEFGSGLVTVKLEPTPSLKMTAGAGTATDGYHVNTGGGVNASASLDYWFRIVGPGVSAPVIVHTVGWANISAPVSASASGNLYAISEARLDDSVIGIACSAGLSLASYFCGTYTGVTSFDVTRAISLSVGYAHKVSLMAGGSVHTAGTVGPGSEFLSAYVDPIFTIDPSFPDADKYTLEFSPGVFNLAPVPEPETFVLMLAGLGVLGAAARGRKIA